MSCNRWSRCWEKNRQGYVELKYILDPSYRAELIAQNWQSMIDSQLWMKKEWMYLQTWSNQAKMKYPNF